MAMDQNIVGVYNIFLDQCFWNQTHLPWVWILLLSMRIAATRSIATNGHIFTVSSWNSRFCKISYGKWLHTMQLIHLKRKFKIVFWNPCVPTLGFLLQQWCPEFWTRLSFNTWTFKCETKTKTKCPWRWLKPRQFSHDSDSQESYLH